MSTGLTLTLTVLLITTVFVGSAIPQTIRTIMVIRLSLTWVPHTMDDDSPLKFPLRRG